jgi:hypothetical protein
MKINAIAKLEGFEEAIQRNLGKGMTFDDLVSQMEKDNKVKLEIVTISAD